MAFVDEYHKTGSDIYKIANNAADNFLTSLCGEKKSNKEVSAEDYIKKFSE